MEQTEKGAAGIQTPTWVLLVALVFTTLSALAALFPWLAAAGNGAPFFCVVGVGAFAVSLLYLTKSPQRIARTPTASELLVAFGVALFAFASVAMVLFVLYGLVYAVIWLVNFALGLLSLTGFAFKPALLFYVGNALLVVFGWVFAAQAARAVAKWVYPSAPPRALWQALRNSAQTASLVLSVPALVGFVFLVLWGLLGRTELSTMDYFWQVVLMLFATQPAHFLSRQREEVAYEIPIDEQVKDAFRKSGFEIEDLSADPSGKMAPLADKIDFVALQGARALVVKVKTPADSKAIAVNWTDVSALGTAAAIFTKLRDRPIETLQPLLVLVDAKTHPNLPVDARENGVTLLRTTRNQLEKITTQGLSPEERETLALNL